MPVPKIKCQDIYQIPIVVRDLCAPLRQYSEAVGIGQQKLLTLVGANPPLRNTTCRG